MHRYVSSKLNHKLPFSNCTERVASDGGSDERNYLQWSKTYVSILVLLVAAYSWILLHIHISQTKVSPLFHLLSVGQFLMCRNEWYNSKAGHAYLAQLEAEAEKAKQAKQKAKG